MPGHKIYLPQERAEVREGAIFLFGNVIYYGGKKFRHILKNMAFQAAVPLLFHMADPCPEVAMVSVPQLSWAARRARLLEDPGRDQSEAHIQERSPGPQRGLGLGLFVPSSHRKSVRSILVVFLSQQLQIPHCHPPGPWVASSG